jgi:hypothetical protein
MIHCVDKIKKKPHSIKNGRSILGFSRLKFKKVQNVCFAVKSILMSIQKISISINSIRHLTRF